MEFLTRMPSPVNMAAGNSNPVGRMFDSIAPTYDILNHILSFGMDFIWRHKLTDIINTKDKLRVIDLSTGTGDVLISLLRRHPNITEAVGLDISEKMLTFCRRKIARYQLNDRVRLVHTDAAATGLAGKNFDYVTMGFGIRNTPDAFETLTEIHRLLSQGGKVLILEFSIPANRIIRSCYLFYLRYFVLFLSRPLSGDKNAYCYLNTSIEDFHSKDDFCLLMQKAGFTNVNTIPLTFGIARIYHGRKSEK